ncbi:UNKNOWN [Stylonychia lemnae]|uniref:Uncharacterized protein n=1 Tax=Stylonychia lemnae TaxID=5949 RepID=A0A078AS20_STYLE|nr:UNKNOWN [Stylonychia lemnae]|eukprot:CDW85280.1 UNKNOWN [Stylonychia lemnae]
MMSQNNNKNGLLKQNNNNNTNMKIIFSEDELFDLKNSDVSEQKNDFNYSVPQDQITYPNLYDHSLNYSILPIDKTQISVIRQQSRLRNKAFRIKTSIQNSKNNSPEQARAIRNIKEPRYQKLPNEDLMREAYQFNDKELRSIIMQIQKERQQSYELGMRKLKSLDLKQANTLGLIKQRKQTAIIQSLEFGKDFRDKTGMLGFRNFNSKIVASPQHDAIATGGAQRISLEPLKSFRKYKFTNQRKSMPQTQTSIFYPNRFDPLNNTGAKIQTTQQQMQRNDFQQQQQLLQQQKENDREQLSGWQDKTHLIQKQTAPVISNLSTPKQNNWVTDRWRQKFNQQNIVDEANVLFDFLDFEFGYICIINLQQHQIWITKVSEIQTYQDKNVINFNFSALSIIKQQVQNPFKVLIISGQLTYNRTKQKYKILSQSYQLAIYRFKISMDYPSLKFWDLQVWVLNDKYITLPERRESQANQSSISILEQSQQKIGGDNQNSNDIILPIQMYMNERALEFLEHFGTLNQQKKYYFCKEEVPFDSSDFYDFEEKKFYYLVSHTDYCSELESMNNVQKRYLNQQLNFSQVNQSSQSPKFRKNNTLKGAYIPKIHQIYLPKWMQLSYSNKLLLVVFLHSYLEGLISQEVLNQMLELIVKDTQNGNNRPGSINQEIKSLIYNIPAHLQMGITIYLRQDLINNLQEEELQETQTQLPNINQSNQQHMPNLHQDVSSPMSFGGGIGQDTLKSPKNLGAHYDPSNLRVGPEMNSLSSSNNRFGTYQTFSTNSGLERMNFDKMLQILECLNINNLIYKFSEVQKNIEQQISNDLNASTDRIKKPHPYKTTQVQANKQISIPKMVDFPKKELERDGDHESYYVEGSMGNLKNILSIMEETQDKNKIKFTFFEKYGQQQAVKEQNSKAANANANHIKKHINKVNDTKEEIQSKKLPPVSSSQQNQNQSQQADNVFMIVGQRQKSRDKNDSQLQNFKAQKVYNQHKPSTEEHDRKPVNLKENIESEELQRRTADIDGRTNNNNNSSKIMDRDEQFQQNPTISSQDKREDSRTNIQPIKVPSVLGWPSGSTPPVMPSDNNSEKTTKRLGTGNKNGRKQSVNGQPIMPIHRKTSNKKVVFNQYLQNQQAGKTTVNQFNPLSNPQIQKSKSGFSFKSNDYTVVGLNSNQHNVGISAQKSQSNTMNSMLPKFQSINQIDQQQQATSGQLGLPPSTLSYYNNNGGQIQNNLESIQSSSYFSNNMPTLYPMQRDAISKKVLKSKDKNKANDFLKVYSSRRDSQDPNTQRENNHTAEGGQLPTLKKSQSVAQIGSAPFKYTRIYQDSLVAYNDQRGQSAIKSQKSLADLHQVQVRTRTINDMGGQSSLLKSKYREFGSSFKMPTPFTDNRNLSEKSLQMSHHQSILGQASNYILVEGQKKKGQVRTRDMWAGIHRTQDVVKCFTNNEHVKRIISREGTPWVKHSMIPSFQNRKDPFVQKYQILLNHVQREKNVIQMAVKEREKMVNELQEQQQQMALVQAQNPVETYSNKLKFHFDNYIKALALDKQLFSLENVDEEPTEKSILDYYKDKSKSEDISKNLNLALENDASQNVGDAGNSYFITQKDKFM